MSKQIRIVAGSLAVLAVALLAAAFGHKVAVVHAGQAAASASSTTGSGAVPCDTSKSAAASELCGTSTDPAHWMDGAGIAGGLGAGSAHWATQPTFFPPDAGYTHFAIPKGDEKYAALSGVRIKGYINDITGISRKSRDDGNQYWGRLTGSEYDHMTEDYVAAQLKRVGVQDVHLQKFNLPPQWWPTHWEVSVTGAGGKTVKLESAFPHWAQPCDVKDCSLANKGTEGKTWDLQPVWVGLGTAADYEGKDIKGKAVLIYSIPAPGGRDYSANWSGAARRAWDGGAAVVFTILGFPGNHINHNGMASTIPTFSLGLDDATTIREMIEKKESPIVHVNEAVEFRTGLYTNSVWGTLPGTTDENVLIMAHTEAPMQGALDNASGIGTMIELAEYYASLPKSQRKRTITFLTTSAHHTPAPNGGIQWVRKHYDFSKTALIVNCEHTAGMVFTQVGSDLVGSNAIAPGRYYVQGGDDLKALVSKTFTDFGVPHYSRPAPASGGELGELRGLAPGFHVLNEEGYHTDLDIPQYVPEAGAEAVVRAYAKIIDEVNKMPLDSLRKNMGTPTVDRWTPAIESQDASAVPVPK